MNARKARAIRRIANIASMDRNMVADLNAVFLDAPINKVNPTALLNKGVFYKNLKKGFKLLRTHPFLKAKINGTTFFFSHTGRFLRFQGSEDARKLAEIYVQTVGNYRAMLNGVR